MWHIHFLSISKGQNRKTQRELNMVHLKIRNVEAKLPHLVLDMFDGFVSAMVTWLPVFLWNSFTQHNAHLPPNMQAGASERQRVVVCTLGAIAAGLVGGANGYIFWGWSASGQWSNE